MHMRCEKCGAVYQHEILTQWGKLKETDGYGPRAACVQLVDNPGAPLPRKTDGRVEDKPAQEWCGGSLETVPVTVPRTVADLSPITEGRTS